MSVTLQLFIYNTPLTRDNNFPLIPFDSTIDMYAFITRLKSTSQRSDTTAPYFVINNPQLLPSVVRRPHMHAKKRDHFSKQQTNDSDSESEDEDDKYDLFDSIFLIYENVDELRKLDIDNNTRSDTGFAEYVQTFKW
jgi:hypothetical protein